VVIINLVNQSDNWIFTLWSLTALHLDLGKMKGTYRKIGEKVMKLNLSLNVLKIRKLILLSY
jgi:hypothetical protein